MRALRFALFASAVVGFPLGAQAPIRVVRHAPADTASAGDVITISFDRPVAGAPEQAGNPARFVRLEPAIPAVVQWRDPVTLRVIPREPLAPGLRVRVTVDTSFAAIDGGRLAAPYRFTILTRGPAIVGSVPLLSAGHQTTLDPSGRLLLSYSAPVDTTAMRRSARLQLTDSTGACRARVIRYRLIQQRPLADSDPWGLRYSGSWDRDTLADRFRRVVELRPVEPIPEGCEGDLVLPSLNPADRAEIRYQVRAQPRFTLAQLHCAHSDCGAAEQLTVEFSAPVHRDSLTSRLRLEPAVPFTVAPSDAPLERWTLRVRVMPRTTYRVHVTSTLTDVFGRRITGELAAAVTTGDREPALGHQLGFFSVSRARPTLRLTHVNVDSAELVIVPIPNRLRSVVLDAASGPDSVARMVGRLQDTVIHRVRLSAPFNVERVSEIPIPSSVVGRRDVTLFAIRARPIERPTPAPAEGSAEALVAAARARQRSLVPRLAQRTAIIQVTDLMAHAKVADGWGGVLVTDANDGRPVAGALVSMRDGRDAVMASAVTDSSGVADLRPSSDWHRPRRVATETNERRWAYDPGDARLLEVVRGSDRSLTPVTPSGFGRTVQEVRGTYTPARLARASVYADRGIYRPGESVYLSTVLRRGPPGEPALPEAGDSVRVRVWQRALDGNVTRTLRDTVLHVNAFGTVADSFTLSRSALLGGYGVEIDDPATGTRHIGSTHFTVAEYRVPEFEATLTMDTTLRWLGDTLRARVSARYYFGAPMPGSPVRWTATTSYEAGWFAPPGLAQGFQVAMRYNGAGGRSPRYVTRSGVDTLDASGTAVLRLPTTAGAVAAPAHVGVGIAIEDINRQAVTAHATTRIHSATFYIAARDSVGGYWTPGVPRVLEVLAVRPSGARVTGVPIRVRVIHHRVVYTEQPDGASPSVKWVADTILRDSLVTADAPVRYTVVPRGAGQYEVSFAARDERGKALETSLGAHLVPGEWSDYWAVSKLGLPVRLEQESVGVGDTMTVKFSSPFARAQAWVTVERETIIDQRRLMVSAGETSVRIPVTRRFVPGAQVSVLLVESGSTWSVDSVHRRIRTGYASLSVDHAERALRVRVAPDRSSYEPGDSATIAVTVHDHRSRPVVGEVTLWAVDEGVLALAHYSHDGVLASLADQPWTSLGFLSTAATAALRRRLLSPEGWDLVLSDRNELRSLSANMAMAAAAGRGFASPVAAELLARSTFRSTAFYLPGLVTDSTGHVSARVKLPDNVTTFRVMAVAVTRDHRSGSGGSALVLSKRLMARPSLPRFLRERDVFVAGAVINNATSAELVAETRVSGGKVVRSGDSIVRRAIPAGDRSEVRFNWRTDAMSGDTAVFRFDVTGGLLSDAVELSVPIRAPYRPRHHAAAGLVRDRASVRLMLPNGIDPARSRLTLRVGTTPAPTVRAAYQRMIVTSYRSSEYLASAGQVVMAMLRLHAAGILDSSSSPNAAGLRAQLQFVVDELARRQAESGHIGYWNRESLPDVFVSAYAGAVLLDARAAGARVDTAVIPRLREFLGTDFGVATSSEAETYGTRAERRRHVMWSLSCELAAVDFLRRAGSPDRGRENRLMAAEAEMMWEDRVLLAEMLGQRTDRTAARAQLARVWRNVRTVGARADIPDSLLQAFGFRSHVRPVARLLRATLAIDPEHAMLAPLVERVVQQGRAEVRYVWNSVDYAAAASVLADVAIMQRSAIAGTVEVRSTRGGAEARILLRGSAQVVRDSAVMLDGLLEPDGDSLALPLQIEASGAPAYYVLSVEEIPLQPPTTPDDRGITVERWFERFDDGRPTTEVKEGDLVRGRLRVTVPSDREFVAVEDLLPAGLEVVDLSLRTSSTLGPFESEATRDARTAGDRANRAGSRMPWLYGSWRGGWWSPWEHREIHDDRVTYFARVLWKGTYTASYVARATTVGTFVRPPAQAEETYNASVGGRSDGGVLRITPRQ